MVFEHHAILNTEHHTHCMVFEHHTILNTEHHTKLSFLIQLADFDREEKNAKMATVRGGRNYAWINYYSSIHFYIDCFGVFYKNYYYVIIIYIANNDIANLITYLAINNVANLIIYIAINNIANLIIYIAN